MALEHYMLMAGTIRSTQTTRRSSGFSLIELMIAMAVLAMGLLGGIMVIVVATANNSRSKLHSTAATMAQSTMEKILAIPKRAVGTAAVTKTTDCAGNTFTIQTAPGGSPLIHRGAFSGSVNFSLAPIPDYSMRYVMCSTGDRVAYDVRWRIDPGSTPSTQLVTVSAKPVVKNGIAALPYTLHQERGNF